MRLGDRRLVAVEPVGLVDDLAVPVEAEGPQVVQLAAGELPARRHPVQVLHPHHEPAAGRPGEQPRHERGPQVADVQVTRGAGREPSDCHDVHSMADRQPPGDAEVADRRLPAAGPRRTAPAGASGAGPSHPCDRAAPDPGRARPARARRSAPGIWRGTVASVRHSRARPGGRGTPEPAGPSRDVWRGIVASVRQSRARPRSAAARLPGRSRPGTSFGMRYSLDLRRVAARQHGLVTLEQAVADGWSRATWYRACAGGGLVLLAPTVAALARRAGHAGAADPRGHPRPRRPGGRLPPISGVPLGRGHRRREPGRHHRCRPWLPASPRLGGGAQPPRPR